MRTRMNDFVFLKTVLVSLHSSRFFVVRSRQMREKLKKVVIFELCTFHRSFHMKVSIRQFLNISMMQ